MNSQTQGLAKEIDIKNVKIIIIIIGAGSAIDL